MVTLPPSYLAPPVGVRRRRAIGNSGDFTRRDSSEGPYNIFISYVPEAVSPCRVVDLRHYRPFWKRATPHIQNILWGSRNEREGAMAELQNINHEINAKNIREFRTSVGVGCVEVKNWYQAGSQLELAVRDALLYLSTSRYEDVRDFIWERIQNRHYPQTWEVNRNDFERRVMRLRPQFASTSQELDSEDSAYCDTTCRPQAESDLDQPANSARTRRFNNRGRATDRARRSRIRSRGAQMLPAPRLSQPADSTRRSHPARAPQARRNVARPPSGQASSITTRSQRSQRETGHESPRMRHLATIR